MTNTTLPPQNFNLTIKNQALRIWEDALYFSLGHFHESRWWGSVNLWIGIPTTFLAAITGITSITGSNNSSMLLGLNSSVITPILAFTVAAMSGLSTFLDPSKQSAKHYHAASEYQALVNDIRLFCEVDCAREGNVEKLEDSLRRFNSRLNKLNNEPIIISRRAKKIVEKEIKEGKHDYRIDKESEIR